MTDDQAQFLTVVSPEEAHQRWWSAVKPAPRPPEPCALAELLGRRLAVAVAAPLDVPGFDRANVDGFAVLAADTYGASERRPQRLRRLTRTIHCGVASDQEITPGHAAPIATGGAMPRGADAVVMVEDTDPDPDDPGFIFIKRPTTPGAMISFAGADITRGEVMLRPGDHLGPREIGVLAALGLTHAHVHPRPRVAILSTGDELVPPGAPRPHAKIHDCNQELLAATCRDLGADVRTYGIIPDDLLELRRALALALQDADLLLLSGGTSKGAGDLSVRALSELPGPTPTQSPVLVHGVALKPGKPLCLAATARTPPSPPHPASASLTPIAILPGFPTSALFTFHEFVAPLLRALAGAPPQPHHPLQASLPHAIRSERGRREYHLVQLLAPLDPHKDPPIALPIGKGSGSVTAFARADGFFAVDQQQERLGEAELVEITRLGPALTPDLLLLGSHCTGLERLADRLHARGVNVRLIAQGSQAGLLAAERGLCDIAPIHLCDPETGRYNAPFVPDNCVLVPGYQRIQGILARPGDPRLAALGPAHRPLAPMGRELRLPPELSRPDLIMVNRNRGSGTRVLLDRLLAADPTNPRPRGYHHEARSHQGVAACVRQGRADWGLAIANVAEGLDFWPLAEESFDLLIPRDRLHRPPVAQFLKELQDPDLRAQLRADGFRLPPP
jgi:putative molybdopterin biosynthesis protein